VLDRRVMSAAAEAMAALSVGVLAGLLLFESQLGLYDGVVSRHFSYAFAVAAGAVSATAAPLLMMLIRRAGRWAVAAVGVSSGTVLLPLDVAFPPGWYGLHEVLLGAAFGLALGGVLTALTTAPGGRRPAIAAGLAAGLPAGWGALALAESWLGWQREAGLWVAGAAVAVVFTVAVLVALADRPGREPAADRRLAGHVWPVVVVAAVMAAGLAAEVVTRSVVAAAQGPPSPSLSDFMAVDVTMRVATAVTAGVVLAWYGYRLGRAAAARWVCAGFGLGIPMLVGLQHGFWVNVPPSPEPRPGSGWLLAVIVAAAAAGVALSRIAGRVAPWEAPGLLAAAVGMWLLAGQPAGTLAHYALAAGIALTLGAGLSQVTSWSPPGRAPGEAAAAGALGFAAALAVTNALAPITSWTSSLSQVSPVRYDSGALLGPLIAVSAALAVTAFFWLSRGTSRRAGPDRPDTAPVAGPDYG
jgi:hypothetical protein